MAKDKRSSKKEPKAAPKPAGGPGPLAQAVATFARGDYARARKMLEEKAKDDSLSESQRAYASELAAATRVERGALWVGLACVGLYLLVAIATALTQP